MGCRVKEGDQIIRLLPSVTTVCNVYNLFVIYHPDLNLVSWYRHLRGVALKTPSLAVDTVLLFQGKLVLIRRKNPPYKGFYALPGGYVDIGESVESAAIRESKEETGLNMRILDLIGVYSDPGRDPRGHVVSIAYLAEGSGETASGSDAASAEVFPLDSLPPLAFDHRKIIEDAMRLMQKRQCEQCERSV
jgi:8-oxo-dGTP diphosphatase